MTTIVIVSPFIQSSIIENTIFFLITIMENNKSNWDCEPQAISGDFGGPNNSAFEIPKASTSFDPMAFGTSPSNTIQAKHMRANHVNFSVKYNNETQKN